MLVNLHNGVVPAKVFTGYSKIILVPVKNLLAPVSIFTGTMGIYGFSLLDVEESEELVKL